MKIKFKMKEKESSAWCENYCWPTWEMDQNVWACEHPSDGDGRVEAEAAEVSSASEWVSTARGRVRLSNAAQSC